MYLAIAEAQSPVQVPGAFAGMLAAIFAVMVSSVHLDKVIWIEGGSPRAPWQLTQPLLTYSAAPSALDELNTDEREDDTTDDTDDERTDDDDTELELLERMDDDETELERTDELLDEDTIGFNDKK